MRDHRRPILPPEHQLRVGVARAERELLLRLPSPVRPEGRDRLRVEVDRPPSLLGLSQELQDFELRVNDNANLVSGAFRTGAHDDLVVALGLSCLSDPWRRRVAVSSASLWA